MIVRDEAKIARDALETVARDKWDQNIARVDALRQHEAALEGPRSKLNEMAQQGQSMSTLIFEAKLRRLLPKVVFAEFSQEELNYALLVSNTENMQNAVRTGRWKPGEPWDHRKLMHPQWDPSQPKGLVQICLYPREFMPEFSSFYMTEKEIPNPEYISTGKVATPDSPISRVYKVSDGVYKKGWRQVLIEVLQTGLINRTDIEREFGNANTPEWAQKFNGRTDITRPW